MARLGFLYTGLNHNAYYWEILLHFRKVLMICINVFLTTFKPLYRVSYLPLFSQLSIGLDWIHADDSIH